MSNDKRYVETKYADNYRNPWEEQKEGFWTIHKRDGCTSMRKINPEEGTQELEAFHYAMAVCYDVMLNEISNTVNGPKPYSLSDIVLNTINAIGKIVNERRKDVGI
jgi:hypothetical protein